MVCVCVWVGVGGCGCVSHWLVPNKSPPRHFTLFFFISSSLCVPPFPWRLAPLPLTRHLLYVSPSRSPFPLNPINLHTGKEFTPKLARSLADWLAGWLLGWLLGLHSEWRANWLSAWLALLSFHFTSCLFCLIEWLTGFAFDYISSLLCWLDFASPAAPTYPPSSRRWRTC